MRIIQIMDALDYGDGVSNDAINIKSIFDELGIVNEIRTLYYHEKVKDYREDFEQYSYQPGDVMIHHFSGESKTLRIIQKMQGYKICRYHNVTPPEFFKENKELEKLCKKGLEQIKTGICYFDAFLPESRYNANDLCSFGADSTKITVIPIQVDAGIKHNSRIKGKGRKILHVGRIAPNKCIEDIISVFAYYTKYFDSDAELSLVGNNEQDVRYFEKIKGFIDRLDCADKIHFTGKVSDAVLQTFYKTSDAYLCMSEHEGFCIPLLEAMPYMPVFAFEGGAVSETMRGSGVLCSRKERHLIAAAISSVCGDKKLLDLIMDKQRECLSYYSKESVKQLLREKVKEWEKNVSTDSIRDNKY